MGISIDNFRDLFLREIKESGRMDLPLPAKGQDLGDLTPDFITRLFYGLIYWNLTGKPPIYLLIFFGSKGGYDPIVFDKIAPKIEELEEEYLHKEVLGTEAEEFLRGIIEDLEAPFPFRDRKIAPWEDHKRELREKRSLSRGSSAYNFKENHQRKASDQDLVLLSLRGRKLENQVKFVRFWFFLLLLGGILAGGSLWVFR